MMPEISIHALLAESDKLTVCQNGQLPDFYPRSPCGERLDDILAGVNELLISIHALLAESDALAPKQNPTQQRISIHALLAESDAVTTLEGGSLRDFYPRSPCGERRVTVLGIQHRVGISIHALLAESDEPATSRNNKHNIFLSTLSLRRATPNTFRHCTTYLFLSTLSLRRATHAPSRNPCPHSISIHALLAESDGRNG